MRVQRLQLDQFRRYEHFTLDVPHDGLRIVGSNASGKTSLIEALVLLATTKSPRVSNEAELIRWESGQDFGVPPYARITGTIETNEGEHELGIVLESPATGASTSKKKCLVDGKSVRASTMVGHLKVVEFSPEDVQLVTGPPSERRRQIDILISQIDRHYMAAASRYAKVLSQRNGLLRQFSRDGVSPRSRDAVEQLSFWDEELVVHGSKIISSRASVIAELNTGIQAWAETLMDGPTLNATYNPGVPGLMLEHHEVPLGHARERMLHELFNARAIEFRRGTTTLGPQRDDLDLTIDGRSLAAFGSRGQQRLGVIALKLSESDVIERLTGETPVLLLDDVLSELDERHATLLLESVTHGSRQVVVTSAIHSAIDHPQLAQLQLLDLHGQ